MPQALLHHFGVDSMFEHRQFSYLRGRLRTAPNDAAVPQLVDLQCV